MKPKKGHPWKQWSPGQFKQQGPAPKTSTPHTRAPYNK